ncbi:MAG: hypothetical protein NZ775_00155 [Gammaproteobacteria bacterium]|nr:hypothetical protein [Gammaproteobacteria bacterium]
MSTSSCLTALLVLALLLLAMWDDDPYSLCSLMASFTAYLTRPISSEVLHSVGRVVNCKIP